MDRSTRRRFLTGVGAAAVVSGVSRRAAAQGAGQPRAFRAARHAADDWLDAIPGRHRIFIDAATAKGAGEAILFAANTYAANRAGYGLGDGDLAIVVCMRHFATPFAFNDAFWAKYGQIAYGLLQFPDPKTKGAPSRNLYQSADYGMDLPNLGNTLDSVIAKGTHVAICDMASHFFAGEAAKAMGADADAVYKEFVASAPKNSHFVAAGVVAVNRAQERGYTLIYAG
jgi:hypothetical protein